MIEKGHLNLYPGAGREHSLSEPTSFRGEQPKYQIVLPSLDIRQARTGRRPSTVVM